jgi:hypothetical protein
MSDMYLLLKPKRGPSMLGSRTNRQTMIYCRFNVSDYNIRIAFESDYEARIRRGFSVTETI